MESHRDKPGKELSATQPNGMHIGFAGLKICADGLWNEY